MAFYDNVKDRVRDDDTDTETEDEGNDTTDRGDNVAFDELIKNAREQDDEEEREPEEDDTEIEDFSTKQSSGGDYADPSSIELTEDAESQAGREGQDGSAGTTDTTETTPSTGRDTDTPSPSRQDADTGQDDGTEVELHQDGSIGEPGSDPEEEVVREESELTVLQEIRNQNEQMLGLLRAIKKNLDQR